MNHALGHPRPLSHGTQFEKTQAEYYTSTLYPEPMTIEYIHSAKPHRIPKNGQCPPPYNKWTPHDSWGMRNNNWFHSYHDKFTAGVFNSSLYGILNTDHQPRRDDVVNKLRVYDDDIIGQTAAGLIYGAQLGLIFSYFHCHNIAFEAGIFQSATMPPNQWMPLHKANWRFRGRLIRTCMAQMACFLGTFQFVEGSMSKFRKKDDYYNSVVAGMAIAPVMSVFYGNVFQLLTYGTIWGFVAASFRFGVWSKDAAKPCLDFDRPLWGISGPINMFWGQQPFHLEKGELWTWISPKYRVWGGVFS